MAQSSSMANNRVSDTASNYASSAGEALKGGYDRASQEAQRGYEYTLDTFKSRPMESVAIALGAGILAGIAIGMSMFSSRR